MTGMKKWVLLFIVLALSIITLRGGVLASSPLRNDSPFIGPISVLLYHSWEEGFEATFREHLKWLKQNGYQTIDSEALIDYLEGGETFLPPKPILLTFDDGTIEDYEIVYAMLEEFDYEGISFVPAGRPFTHFSKKLWWREVNRCGVLDIENHSHAHGLIWTGPQIIDFYSGEDPDGYFLIKGLDLEWGAPIYEYDYELVSRRYFPDRRIARLCVNHVAQNGGEDFFKKEGWRDELWQLVENFRSHHQERGSYETKGQKHLRFRTELYRSKRMIEQTIGHKKQVEFFAYPWGVYDEELILQLKSYGYRGAFTTDWGGNFPGDDPFKIKRFVITSDMTVEDLADILEVEQ